MYVIVIYLYDVLVHELSRQKKIGMMVTYFLLACALFISGAFSDSMFCGSRDPRQLPFTLPMQKEFITLRALVFV